ncbi:MAG: hypothetical protein UR26_C0002G0179 [candidate division TM6 bacterium GW2011_GWF2_32_72]|nr:MAG: hypothetical protein UR26_C0002G0179 [candidate division TM6 bacterium GW2011_GWF2_32_72]
MKKCTYKYLVVSLALFLGFQGFASSNDESSGVNCDSVYARVPKMFGFDDSFDDGMFDSEVDFYNNEKMADFGPCELKLDKSKELISWWKRKLETLPISNLRCDEVMPEDWYKKYIKAKASILCQIDFEQVKEDFAKKCGLNGGEDWIDYDSYAGALVFSENSKIVVFSDLHGDVHKFVNILSRLFFDDLISDDFVLVKGIYFLFLGDYVDRGWYGDLVLYLIEKLKIINPDNVILLKGNHDINVGQPWYLEGFTFSGPELEELLNNLYYEENESDHEKIRVVDLTKIYDNFDEKHLDDLADYFTYFHEKLFATFFIGFKSNNSKKIQFIQCVHGGVNLNCDFESLLNDAIKKSGKIVSRPIEISINACEQVQDCYGNAFPDSVQAFYDRLEDDESKPFVWGDFLLDNQRVDDLAVNLKKMVEDRCVVYDSEIINAYLDSKVTAKFEITNILRGHQHHDLWSKDVDKGMLLGGLNQYGIYFLSLLTQNPLCGGDKFLTLGNRSVITVSSGGGLYNGAHCSIIKLNKENFGNSLIQSF